MRYRTAHWWLAALLPLIVLAFWPGYFSQMHGASLAHHVHGGAGALWIVLAAFQSWTIATRRFALHRLTGQAIYPVIALFVAGGTLAISEMATGFVGEVDPFRLAFGARLALLDASAVIAAPLLVRDALAHRRRVGRHSASMLATVLLILPPMIARLLPYVPAYPPGFEPALYGGELIGAVIAGGFWLRDRRDGGAFLAVALLDVAQCLSFAIYGGEALTRMVATLSPLPTAALTAGLAVLVLMSGVKPQTPVARPVAAA